MNIILLAKSNIIRIKNLAIKLICVDYKAEPLTACIRNSGFSAKSKVSDIININCQTESEELFNQLLIIHVKRYIESCAKEHCVLLRDTRDRTFKYILVKLRLKLNVGFLMNPKYISINKVIIISIITILFSAIFAIIVHAILPAPVDVTQFDGILVKLFGFPFVASLYFIILFAHCSIVVRYIGVRSEASNFQTGIRFGVVFAMIYLLGMQEVVVEASPFSNWGIEFVKYQFFMGMGDAIPAMVLCLIISHLTIPNKEKRSLVHKLHFPGIVKAVIIIAIAIVVGRTVANESGLISSNCVTYPIPTYAWTVLFGFMLGFIYVILYPLLAYKNNLNNIPFRLTVVVGVNWIIFNSFIGLIFKDAMLDMLLRSGLDVLILYIASTIIGKNIIAK